MMFAIRKGEAHPRAGLVAPRDGIGMLDVGFGVVGDANPKGRSARKLTDGLVAWNNARHYRHPPLRFAAQKLIILSTEAWEKGISERKGMR